MTAVLTLVTVPYVGTRSRTTAFFLYGTRSSTCLSKPRRLFATPPDKLVGQFVMRRVVNADRTGSRAKKSSSMPCASFIADPRQDRHFVIAGAVIP